MTLCLLCPLLGQGEEYALGNHLQGDRNLIKDELCDASLFSQLEVGAPKLLVAYVIKGFEELSLFSKYIPLTGWSWFCSLLPSSKGMFLQLQNDFTKCSYNSKILFREWNNCRFSLSPQFIVRKIEGWVKIYNGQTPGLLKLCQKLKSFRSLQHTFLEQPINYTSSKIRSDDAERLQSAQWSAQWGNHRCEAGGVQSRPPETERTLVAQNINGQL